jgi:hypothetical protein
MAFINCKLCNRVREVQPHGPAYSTTGYCQFHLNQFNYMNRREDIEPEPINTPKRKTINLDKVI